ncbi:MAG: DUF3810 domain-containing protein [Lachnospiraceae bacterium]|nr:DUF3810 domain-containing protein [Lachnospiraceae bacterium]
MLSNKVKVKKNNKPGVYAITIIVLIVLIAVINLISWNSKVISDWYRENIFILWGPLYGTVTGRTDKSVGEIMLGVATVLILLFIIAIILLAIKKIRRVCVTYIKVFVLILCIVGLIQTLNCFVLYHTSTFEEQYVSEYLKDKGDRKYTIEELASLRDIIVSRANELGRKMPRDYKGDIICEEDLAGKAVEYMEALGDKYSGLSGYYTRPKALYTSEFFSQQYIMGYYFPFSMEANYNDVMYVSNKPHTMCHELAHTKGYISEDEANLIGFLACINSDDDFFKYSGYLSVIGYIDKDLKESILVDTARSYGLNVNSSDEINRDLLEASGIDVDEYVKIAYRKYNSYEHISDVVRHDRIFLTKEAWNKVESNAVLDTETVAAASDAFINANLKVNGVSQGDAIYSEVVALLMDFYVYNIEEELQ